MPLKWLRSSIHSIVIAIVHLGSLCRTVRARELRTCLLASRIIPPTPTLAWLYGSSYLLPVKFKSHRSSQTRFYFRRRTEKKLHSSWISLTLLRFKLHSINSPFSDTPRGVAHRITLNAVVLSINNNFQSYLFFSFWKNQVVCTLGFVIEIIFIFIIADKKYNWKLFERSEKFTKKFTKM